MQAGALSLRSTAFAPGGPIPRRFACDGPDVSPPLSWSGVPSGTRQLALLVQDLTTPFVHWALAGVGPATRSLAGGAIPAGAVQGRNDFGRVGYGGPCPALGGGTHRYRFTLYALASTQAPAPGFDVRSLPAIAGALAAASLVGTYRR